MSSFPCTPPSYVGTVTSCNSSWYGGDEISPFSYSNFVEEPTKVLKKPFGANKEKQPLNLFHILKPWFGTASINLYQIIRKSEQQAHCKMEVDGRTGGRVSSSIVFSNYWTFRSLQIVPSYQNIRPILKLFHFNFPPEIVNVALLARSCTLWKGRDLSGSSCLSLC